MWTSPRYRDITGREPPTASASVDDRVAPVDTGVRVLTLDRSTRDGPQSELRVTVAEYQNHKFLSLRVWNHNAQSGVWYPDPKKGISVRLKEAEAVASAIQRGLRLAEGDSDPTTPRGRTTRKDLPGQGRLPHVAAGGPEFSEF